MPLDPRTIMKATTLLERQHRNLQQLCEVVELGSASIRSSLLRQLAGDLVAHIAIEEQVFYPAAFEALREGDDVGMPARHAQVMRALHRALDAPVQSEEFDRAITELRESFELHVAEEEAVVFPLMDRTLNIANMRDLALAMMRVYYAKVEEGYDRAGTVPSAPKGAPRA